jgi:hypothetical protein
LQVSAAQPRIVVGQGFTTRRFTVDSTMRYVGGGVGFAFGAMWMTVGIGSAIVCLLLGALGYGAVWIAERAQANASVPRPTTETFEADADLPLTADEFELEETRYEPPKPAENVRRPVPLAAEADYGWPTG